MVQKKGYGVDGGFVLLRRFPKWTQYVMRRRVSCMSVGCSKLKFILSLSLTVVDNVAPNVFIN